MQLAAQRWFEAQTFDAARFEVEALLEAKAETGDTVSVVIPARNEAATVASVVGRLLPLVSDGVVDELFVLDSDSTDDTADRARTAGATVVAAAQIETGLPTARGKGEALWTSQFVTSGDLLVFIDADLTEWSPQFVTGLLGPLLANPETLLVKGFYDRLVDSDVDGAPQGGRVTELVARPMLNLYWPELAAVVQPLAGEWAVRRSVFQTLSVPVGYAVEFAALTDVWARYGLDALAQVDLGRRGHRHQNVHDLGVMAAEILAAALRRLPREAELIENPSLQQYNRADGWVGRVVPVVERPPAAELDSYQARTSACSG